MNNWQNLIGSEPTLKAYPPSDIAQMALYACTESEVLIIDGLDAAQFLQGQVTCDVSQLTPQHGLSGAACTPQGRVYATFHLLMVDDNTIAMVLPKGMAQSVLQRLTKYIIFSKATLSQRDDLLVLGLSANSDSSDSPSTSTFSTIGDHIALWVGTTDQAARIWREFKNHHYSANAWASLMISFGQAHVTIDTQELWVAQSLNLDLSNAISFEKGCYTGQEIVARLHYRGTPKDRLYRAGLELAGDRSLPSPGTDCIDIDQDKTIGQLANVARTSDTTAEALVVLRSNDIDGKRLQIEAPEISCNLTLLSLPYAIP